MTARRDNLSASRRVLVPLFCCLLAIAGCKKSEIAKTNRKAPLIDACALITGQEIEAIQGSPITEAKSSGRPEGVFRVSQCYYSAAESSKSVSLILTQPDPDYRGKRTPKEFWNETFAPYLGGEDGERSSEHPSLEKGPDRRSNEEEGEEAARPQEIDGIGEAAFFAGNRFGGSLYVLKKEFILRLSLGGTDDWEIKIQKSKDLALKALERL